MPEEKPGLGCRKHWNVGEGFKPSPTGREPKAEHGSHASHKPRVATLFASPSGEVAAGQRGIVVRDVGCGVAVNQHWTFGSCSANTPTPTLPKREGALLRNKLRATGRPVTVTTHHEPIGRTHGSAPTTKRHTTNHGHVFPSLLNPLYVQVLPSLETGTRGEKHVAVR